MNQRISINPLVCHGKPVIRGTRILISQILGELAAGTDFDGIINEYPAITRQDILAALDFSSELAQFDTISYQDLAV